MNSHTPFCTQPAPAMSYADCPADIKQAAKHLVDTFGPDEGLLQGAIAAALYRERKQPAPAAMTMQTTSEAGFKRPSSEQRARFPYQRTFDAIGEAVEWKPHNTVGISVAKFIEAFDASAPTPPQGSVVAVSDALVGGIVFDLTVKHFNGKLTAEEMDAITATMRRSLERRLPASPVAVSDAQVEGAERCTCPPPPNLTTFTTGGAVCNYCGKWAIPQGLISPSIGAGMVVKPLEWEGQDGSDNLFAHAIYGHYWLRKIESGWKLRLEANGIQLFLGAYDTADAAKREGEKTHLARMSDGLSPLSAPQPVQGEE